LSCMRCKIFISCLFWWIPGEGLQALELVAGCLRTSKIQTISTCTLASTTYLPPANFLLKYPFLQEGIPSEDAHAPSQIKYSKDMDAVSWVEKGSLSIYDYTATSQKLNKNTANSNSCLKCSYSLWCFTYLYWIWTENKELSLAQKQR
jgi:hypothetical protein